MRYRRFPKADVEVSALGLGCMRLPQQEGRIDRPQALGMMRRAVERGVNYFDTAYMYHGGESEQVVGEALRDIGRDKVFLATKMPCSMVQTQQDLWRILEDQLQRLGVDTIDFYLLHAVSANTWERMLQLDALTFLDKAAQQGKIRFPGFSHHDSLENFKEIVDAYPKWVMAQVILNYMDDQYQAGLPGSEYAAEKGLGVVVMEPLKGGMLTEAVPENVAALFRAANPKTSLAEWTLRWVYGVPQVTCVLSGASNVEQWEQNLDSFDRFSGLADIALTQEEQELFEAAKLEFLKVKGVRCTACRYCVPCPAGVDIPGVFANYNLIRMFGQQDMAKMRYARLIYAGTSGDKCVLCGRCEGLCPQQLPIMELLKEAHEPMRT